MKYTTTSRIPRFILPSICKVDITIWPYQSESRPKSAFVSAYGKWEFKRCPFGLAQAPAYFQRLVNEVLSGLTFAFGYLDDILIFSPRYGDTFETFKNSF